MWCWCVESHHEQQWGLELGAQLVTIGMLWMSPLCKTVSNADASNIDRGCGYRDHKDDERPPLQDESNVYGRRARQDNLLVMLWIQLPISSPLVHPGLVWFLKNPVGSLGRGATIHVHGELL